METEELEERVSANNNFESPAGRRCCKGIKKRRNQTIGLDFGKPATVRGIRQNPDDSLTFLDENGKPLLVSAGYGGLSYARTKGSKITLQIPEQGNSVGSLVAALGRFDRIVGVDTNSRDHNGEKVCASAICELSNLAFAAQTWSARVDPLWVLEFRSPTKDAERIGWRHTIARGLGLGWHSNNRKILIVVDSHLGDIHAINTRTAPLIDAFFLPPNMSIAYASSDAATDSPLNGLIARCDRIARAVLDEATASSPKTALIQSPRTPFRAHRYWLVAE